MMDREEADVSSNSYLKFLKPRHLRSDDPSSRNSNDDAVLLRSPDERVKTCGRALMERATKVCHNCHRYNWRDQIKPHMLSDLCCYSECSDNQIATSCCFDS
uniref:Uncharacterized protein n=1 Tax=Parastrongyloides trichosuri TaxID=131310 RepID=A0A0N4Z9N7_PARTI